MSMSDIIKSRNLMDISQVEQNIVCHASESDAFKLIAEKIFNSEVKNEDKIRLALIYLGRFKISESKFDDLRAILRQQGISESIINVLMN